MSRKFGNLTLLLAVVLGLGGRALASSTAIVAVNWPRSSLGTPTPSRFRSMGLWRRRTTGSTSGDF